MVHVAENGQTLDEGAATLCFVLLEPAICYEALKARDTRFDGMFFVGVTTTGVYCRPICPARTPGRDRCKFFPSAASAEGAGFRPCLKCRPELAPGHAPVDAPRRVARLALERIQAGELDEAPVDALAASLGLSARQLRRLVEAEYGVSPVALAQTRRLLLAKQLLTDTELRIVDVAFASGFASVRRFNHLFSTHYRLTPRKLRRRKAAPNGTIVLTLAYRPPLAWGALASFIASRGSHGVESFDGRTYRRAVRLGNHTGWISAEPSEGRSALELQVASTLLPVLTPLLARLRRLFDLDASPDVIEGHLGRDSRLARLVELTPGLRIPGTMDGFELALRAVLGQQVTVRAASTLYSRFAAKYGEPIVTPYSDIRLLAPRAEVIAEARLQDIIDLGLTSRRAATVQQLARSMAAREFDLEPSASLESTRRSLLAIPGIGPWTTHYVAMRALADPDAFPHGDLGLLRALGVSGAREVDRAAEAWRPFRAYAAMHLWHGLSAGTPRAASAERKS